MIRFAAWLAAIIYAANPNLIYLQATAMTEPLYLALFIWAMVYFNEFVQQSARPRSEHSSRPYHLRWLNVEFAWRVRA